MKKTLILFFLISFDLTKSQTSNHHVFGIDIGYANWSSDAGGAGLETNVSYYYAYNHFCFKLGGGLAHNTNFGTLPELYLGIGGTTQMNNQLSWRGMLGIYGFEAKNTRATPYPSVTQHLAPLGFSFISGFYFQPIENDARLLLGLNNILSFYETFTSGYAPAVIHDSYSKAYNLFITSISVSYRINGKKYKPTEEKRKETTE